jgi:diaminohydroxyphosphoribosylaminopyrimidine deaminase / 5-amino-6-(5-phosphoribosylamino)uracil reductase
VTVASSINHAVEYAEILSSIARVNGPSLSPPPTPNPASLVIGQIGQSLDGRVSTVTGDSKPINGNAGLLHLHRLRSLVDAVVVGAKTAHWDDPQLTVRMLEGPSPARVVIDPRATLKPSAKVWSEDGVRRVHITAKGHPSLAPAGVERLELIGDEHQLDTAQILSALRSKGFHRILIEGGPDTLGRFINAGLLDRLHLVVAPIILGSGKPGLNLAEISHLHQALSPQVRYHLMGSEMLVDCQFTP